MADLNLGRIISKFINYQALNMQQQQQKAPQSQSAQTTSFTPPPQTQSQSPIPTPTQAQMGGVDQSFYVKDMMKLPKNLNELVYMMQKNITLAQLNQRFASQTNLRGLSQTQAQILAQLQSLSLSTDSVNLNKAVLNQLQTTLKNLPLSSTGMINLSDIAAMIQANGKEAITKLITTMANTAKLGVQDLTQLKETAKLINASVAAASQNDSAQTMKLLMLLYLPWLPLQEGVGFDLEIETGANPDESDSILIITITTINYGNVKAVLILENSNSVQVNIECIKEFPKDELLLRIEMDEKHYSMQSSVNFETRSQKVEAQEKPQAKINMSNTNEINPYLLLMAHTVIRHVIEIDKNAQHNL